MSATGATSSEVFVVDRQTGLFLAKEGYWTSNVAEAQDFKKTPDAVAHCLAHNIANVQIAIRASQGERQTLTFARMPAPHR